MEKPLIYLALTDDWELRGDGSGDIAGIQFQPMRELLRIFDRHGARSTFLVEVMQQLTFRAEQDHFPQLKPLADAWDEHVRDALRRGHDVQLHVHPQWSEAVFENSGWRLGGDWSLLNYEPSAVDEMISTGKRYLENLLRPIDPNYKCVAFRAGSSAIAPSPFILDLLARQGFVFDLSVVGGLRVNTRHVAFDYTTCEEDFLPFYPDMQDARRLSNKEERIVCVPIFHFIGSRRRVALQTISTIYGKVNERLSAKSNGSRTSDYSSNEWYEIGRSSLASRIYDKALKPVIFGKHLTADTGRLDYGMLREMMEKIRKRASGTGLSKVPVILTNHSKYMTDFDGFERFLETLSTADDISMITLSELAGMLKEGVFHVRKAA